jgi:membrane protein
MSLPVMRLKNSVTRFLVHLTRFAYWVGYDFYVRSGLTRAGSLAYNLLLSFVPFIVVAVGIVSFFPVFNQLIHQVETYIFANFVPHTGETILDYLHDFQTHASGLPLISFIFLFVTCMLMLLTLESTVNEMWQIQKPRRFGLSLLLHWGLMTLGPILLCASLLITSFIVSNTWFKWNFVEGFSVLPYLCSTLAFTFLYISVPGCRVRIRAAFLGGVFSSVLFELAKTIFSIYTEYFSTYTLLYGALATIPLFLIWLYVCSVIFLVGAQVVHAFQTHQAYQPLNSSITWLNKIFVLIESFYNKTFQENTKTV